MASHLHLLSRAEEIQQPPGHRTAQNPGQGQTVSLQLGAVNLRPVRDFPGGEDMVCLEIHHRQARGRLEAEVRHALEEDGVLLRGLRIVLPGGNQESEAVLSENRLSRRLCLPQLLRQGGGQEALQGPDIHRPGLLGGEEGRFLQGGDLGGDIGVSKVQVLEDQVGGRAPLGGGEALLLPAEPGLGEGAEVGGVGGVLRDLLVQGAALQLGGRSEERRVGKECL